MSQATTWSVPLSGPATPTDFAERIDNSFDAILTSHKGNSRPTYAEAGTMWVDDSVTPWSLYFYTGSDDILMGTLDAGTEEWKSADKSIEAGTSMLFNQAAAPTGWTRKSDWAANATLVVGNTYATGGTANPISYTTAVAVANHALHTHSGPSHTHNMQNHKHNVTVPAGGWGQIILANGGYIAATMASEWPQSRVDGDRTLTSGTPDTNLTGTGGEGDTGSGGPTTHSITQSTYSPRYVQVIAATRDA
jgi:hypothetical protein